MITKGVTDGSYRLCADRTPFLEQRSAGYNGTSRQASTKGSYFDNDIIPKTYPHQGRRLLILATTSNRPILTDMDAISAFDAQIHVPSIAKLRHLDLVLRQVDLFNDDQAHERAMELLKQAHLNESGKLLIGIKRLLAVAEMAKQVRG